MRRSLVAAALLASSLPASAIELDIVTPDQNAFRAVSEDLVAAFNYKSLQPAEATGITGFGIGAIASYVKVDDPQAWATLTGEDIDAIGIAGLVANKGLPFGFDVAAFYTAVPSTDASVFGARLQWSLWEGGVATPGVALRGAYTKLDGVDDFDLSTYSVDASISKGFAFITPYAGAGYVWGTSDPQNVVGLTKEEVEEARFFAGLRLSALLLEITPEYERVGDRDVFNLRLGLSF